jgi:hypothetical protein
MKCTQCGSDNSFDAKFCRRCGNKIEAPEQLSALRFVHCPKCSQTIESGKNFCPKCGASQNSTAPIPASPVSTVPSSEPQCADSPTELPPPPSDTSIQSSSEGMSRVVVGAAIVIVLVVAAVAYRKQAEQRREALAQVETERAAASSQQDPIKGRIDQRSVRPVSACFMGECFRKSVVAIRKDPLGVLIVNTKTHSYSANDPNNGTSSDDLSGECRIKCSSPGGFIQCKDGPNAQIGQEIPEPEPNPPHSTQSFKDLWSAVCAAVRGR